MTTSVMDSIYEVYANRKIFNVPNILIGRSGDRIFFSVFWGDVPLVRSPFFRMLKYQIVLENSFVGGF